MKAWTAGAFKGRGEEEEEVGGRAVGAGEAGRGESASRASGRRLHTNIPWVRVAALLNDG